MYTKDLEALAYVAALVDYDNPLPEPLSPTVYLSDATRTAIGWVVFLCGAAAWCLLTQPW